MTVEEYNATVKEAADKLGFEHPVSKVQWIPVEQVQANDYNPNAVAKDEMRLLHLSIIQDGYTQPVVCIYDEETEKYVIVDGFHRYTVMRTQKDVYESTGGLLPVVVIDKPLAERMASTIRHNRARGKHSVTGMGNLVFEMLRMGVPDEDICNQLGLEAEELRRLRHVTGFAKLFEGATYTQAWEHIRQIEQKKKWKEAHPEEAGELL